LFKFVLNLKLPKPLFKNFSILLLIILGQLSFNKISAQQDFQIKDKIIGNWYYFADVNENSSLKDYNEIYFDGKKVQESLESMGIVLSMKYKIEGENLLIKKKDTFLFSGKFESISKNKFILIKNGFKRTFYKVNSRITLEKVIKNKISEKFYSKANFRRMSRAKKKFNITPTAEYYYKKYKSQKK